MQADLTPFLDFFTQGFLQSAQSLSQVVKIGEITQVKTETPLRLNQEELQILDYVYRFDSIKISEAVDILSTSKRTAQRRLMALVDKQILSIQGKGPATEYVLN
jgi:predicted HTH transcriptional regulator